MADVASTLVSRSARNVVTGAGRAFAGTILGRITIRVATASYWGDDSEAMPKVTTPPSTAAATTTLPERRMTRASICTAASDGGGPSGGLDGPIRCSTASSRLTGIG